MLNGQSLQARGSNCISTLCDGMVHCKSQSVGHCWKVICLLHLFHQKKMIFVQLCGWPSASQHAAADVVLSSVSLTTNHRPPHSVPDFLSQVFTTPSVGVAHALGLWKWIEYSDTIGVDVKIFI